MRFECHRCRERGKTWNGDAPKCGFDEAGAFQPDNWNCATLNAVRDLAEDEERGVTAWTDDQHGALIPMSVGRFLVISWYKSRGRTEGAWVLSFDSMEPVTLAEAEAALSGER